MKNESKEGGGVLPFSKNFKQVLLPLKSFPKIHPLMGNGENTGGGGSGSGG